MKYLIVLLLALSLNVQADDKSPEGYAQSIQCTVFASMGKVDEDTVSIYRSRVPKEFNMTHAYLVGRAEGQVLGTAVMLPSVVQHGTMTRTVGNPVIDAALMWYRQSSCTINEDT